MSVGAWEPEKAPGDRDNDHSRDEIDRALLEKIIASMQGDVNTVATFPQEIIEAKWLAGLPAQQWLDEATALDPDRLWALIRFFTLAEMQLPDWQGGAESPVIPLAKSLRRRKTPLSRDQLMWIRQHSDNRYLPYGPL
ncbi:hypothetical protein [uncultured Microbulbifer sp.]|uniref:hypothetical protein n=1 Tax=uncultured Microbulbifer sp. TaxID=348147 RepID=UPI0025CF1DDC|nr:hypothetical protein [uncultured Microbulbifer sp.]